MVPARRGRSCLRNILIYYKTFHIYRTCMRRAPERPVRPRDVRVCCTVAVQEHDLRATTLHCKVKRRLSSHFTVPSSHPALQKPHFISVQTTLQQFLSQSKLLHTETILHKEHFTLEPFTHSKLLHTPNFCREKHLPR